MSSAPTIVTARKTGQKPDSFLLPYQRAWVNDESPVKLGEKGRQEGWTWAEAYDAVSRRRRANPRRLNYWFSSTDESAGAEFIDYCAFFHKKLFSAAADRFTEQVEAPETRKGYVTAMGIRFDEDVRITAMSSNPRRFRGKRGDVRVDEAAFHDDAEGMHDAASPVTQWGGTYATWSTHNGEGSLFNQFVGGCRKLYAALGQDVDHPEVIPFARLKAKALEIGVRPVFSYHRVTILDAIEQGLVEKINYVTGRNQTREEFLEDIRLKVRSADAFNQEYLCVASADATAWLTYKLIESCEHVDVPQPDEPLTGYAGGAVHAGVDVGRTKDLTVLTIAEMVGDVQWPRRILQMRGVPIPQQVRIIAEALRPLKLVRVCVDYTGVGIGLGDGLVEELGAHRVENIDLNNKNKEILAIGLLAAMEDKLIRLPAGNQRMRDSLHSVRKEFTATGKPRFVAPRTDEGHADDFWAAALAVHAAVDQSAPDWSGAAVIQRASEVFV